MNEAVALNWTMIGAGAGLFTAIAAAFFAVVKWALNSHKMEIVSQIKTIKVEFKVEKQKLIAVEKEISQHREEMHTKFVSGKHLDDALVDIKTGMDKLFERVNDLSAGQNQIIGALNIEIKKQ